jgi:UDPglucose 6-dehydrogenase
VRICVIGSGYVGLVTAAVFADMGNDVACVDVDEAKVAMLNQYVMPIYEPGLEEMVVRNVKEGRIDFSTNVGAGVESAEIVFICVGTPAKEDGGTDLSYVESAATMIAGHLNGYKIIVNKSTVPVGTGDFVRTIINETKADGHEFDVVSNPEFLREGQAIGDALAPDRVVIGAPNKKVAMKLLELYATLGAPVVVTDVASAELIKYASNAFLAMKISFINAIADICEEAGANIIDVSKGIGLDKRIGASFLNAGLGYGGSCFPKDVLSLIHTSKSFGIDLSLIEQVVTVNEQRVGRFIGRMKKRFPDMNGKTFGVLGLAFKPDTDDMREARAVDIVGALTELGATIRAFDPVASDNAKLLMPQITYCDNPYEVAEGADALVVVTEWREFRLLNMEKIHGAMKSPVIFDGRNIYQPDRIASAGFEYFSIGR